MTQMKSSLRTMLCVALLLGWLNGLCKSNGNPDIKICATVDKSGYVGEALVYEVLLTSDSPEISNVRVTKYPKFPEGVKVVQGIVNNQRPELKESKGKKYYSWTILRYFLIPEREGKMDVGDGNFVVFIPHEKIVSHPFWGVRHTVEYEEMVLSSKAVDFKVKKLPSEKEGYAGCVGDFRIEGWFPPGKIYAGKEAYAVFTISGYGSLESLRLPNIYKLFDRGCKLKEVSREEETMQRDGKFFSEITLTCRFMPEEEEFEIAPLCLQFFNPERGKYYEVCSEALLWMQRQEEKKNKDHNKEAISI